MEVCDQRAIALENHALAFADVAGEDLLEKWLRKCMSLF